MLLLLLLPQLSWAKVGFEGAIGLPEVTMTNGDSSKAHYSGVTLKGSLQLPLYETKFFSGQARPLVKYLDLKNNSNNNDQREMGNHLGLGLGLRFELYRFFLEGSYQMMIARHYWVGKKDNYLEFEYSNIDLTLGFSLKLSKVLRTSFSYSTSSATISKNDLNMIQDANMKEVIYWIHMTFSTGLATGKFFQTLFK
jgi:hypothetical protein